MKLPHVVALIILSIAGLARAETGSAPPGMYIIYDSSNSMWGELADKSRKYQAGRDAIAEFLEEDFTGYELAFRAYGHRSKDDCRDSQLIVPFSAPAAAGTAITEVVGAIRPTGRTPIDYSLRQALKDFGERSGTIVLITDGIESCDADPCALLEQWRRSNVQINVHIVGLGLSAREKAAMACMVEAAGTEFQDAQSAGELSAGLKKVREAAGATAFGFIVVDEVSGEPQSGVGTLTPVDGGEPIQVRTHYRFVVDPGEYLLEGGVKTRDGNAYRPVSQTVMIDKGMHPVPTLTAPRPPQVSARFTVNGEEVRGAQVYAYRDGKQLWSFKAADTAFVNEGSYTFRTTPDRANKDLTLEQDFAHGEQHTLLFEMIETVRAYVRFIASGSGIQYRVNPTLYRDGEQLWTMHVANGGDVTPGDYEVRLQNYLVQFSADLTITDEDNKQYEIVVPSAHVTVKYRNADGSAEQAKRVKVEPKHFKSGGRMRQSNEPIALTPGTYTFTGWPASKGYTPQTIELQAGEERTLALQAGQ